MRKCASLSVSIALAFYWFYRDKYSSSGDFSGAKIENPPFSSFP